MSRTSTRGGTGDHRPRPPAPPRPRVLSRAIEGLHPDLVVRLVRLGLLDAEVRVDHRLQFRLQAQMARAFRIQRLRAGLPLKLCRTRPRDGSP